KAQYWMLFRGIEQSGKFRGMQIITQGYADPFPSYSRSFSWRYPLKFLVNMMLDNGCWLKRPLMIKGIPDSENSVTGIHRMIVKTMIHELNRMFNQLAENFRQVTHIDSRPMFNKQNQWFDELHLRSNEFRKVAIQFEKAIDGFKEA